jgi:hypothetical protein
MRRRVWIIPRKDKIEDSDIASATLNGCPEIANGIPPALQGIISERQLPIVYEEPETSPPIDWQAEWDKATTAVGKAAVLAKMLGLRVS